MRIRHLMGLLRWLMVWTSTLTMLVSPVAMGQEAERVTKKQMQAVMDYLGLNKQMTLGEFYKKNKHLYPERIRKDIEPLFMSFKNQLMPTVEVLSSKNSNGEEVATLRLTQGKELINLQWYGQKEKLLKFQNTNLSEIDVINFDDMFTRIIAGDETFRKQIENNSVDDKVKTHDFSKATKYPDVSKAEWNSMSAQDKANYIVTLRGLWQDARSILRAKNAAKKGKKTSALLNDKTKSLYALVIGSEAVAAGKTVATGEKSANYFSGETCIVAGYVAKYEKTDSGEFCDHRIIDKVYNNKDNSLYKKANDLCSSSSQIACNPYVFGTPNGAPTCVTPSRTADSFQKASHWDGPCDRASRLQSSTTEISILKNKTDKGRYEDNNLMPEKEREDLFKIEQGENFKQTEDYLLGMLKFRGLVKEDVKSIFDSGALSDQIYNQIILDKKGFDNEIAEAQKSCKAESVATKNGTRVHEKNYWPACDQFHRRFLFVQELFQSKCAGQKLNPDTLKCGCAAPPAIVAPGPKGPADTATPVAKITPVPESVPPKAKPFPRIPAEVVAGASCTVVLPPAVVMPQPVPPTDDTSTPPVAAEDCESRFPGSGATGAKCLCPTGGAPKKDVTDIANGSESWSCEFKNADKVTVKAKEECGIACKIFAGIKKYALPVLLIGAMVYAAKKGAEMLAPKKPGLNPALDTCPSGSPPPCAQKCDMPLKIQADGTCSCGGCPPFQAPDINCFCSSGTPTTTQMFLCPDSTTRVADLSKCPTYPCWNGQKYQNPLNCPPAPSVAPASSGTRK